MTGVRPTTATARAARAGDERPGSLRRAVHVGPEHVPVIGLLLGRVRARRRGTGGHQMSAVAQLAMWLVVIVAAVLWQVRAVLHSTHPWLRAVEGAAPAWPCSSCRSPCRTRRSPRATPRRSPSR